MSYQTSYDSGGSGPFKPNKDRGFWASPTDFFYACVCNAFRMDIAFGVVSVHLTKRSGIYTLIFLLLNVVLFAFPIVFMQSFLGQFSSTGFISAFRVAPLFKGVGYIALAINLCFLTFYAIFAAVPLLFFIHSLQPTLPWSCEAWLLRNDTDTLNITHCNGNLNEEFNFYAVQQVPSVEYFWDQFHDRFSVSLYGCVIVVWLVIAFTLCNSTTEKIGKILRYCSMTLLSFLGIVFLRMMFLPGAIGNFEKVVTIKAHLGSNYEDMIRSTLLAPMLTLATFGPGWGTILSMASYNKFKTDINKFSWVICFSQLGVLLMIVFLCMFTESHLTYNTRVMDINHYRLWTTLFSIPSSLETMEFPHLWTWMFLAVLIIGNFNLMIAQMFSVLTAVFDEYETLRLHKVKVILGLSGILALASAYFCTKHGIYCTEIIAEMSISTEAILNISLLIVLAWVYGKERFRRDVEFMTSQVIPTWKIRTVRFVTPLFIGITFVIGCVMLIFPRLYYFFTESLNRSVILNIMIWFALPVYCVFKLLQTNGSFAMRFRRCVMPADWYPTDSEQRQRYEETIDNPETFQTLTTIDL